MLNRNVETVKIYFLLNTGGQVKVDLNQYWPPTMRTLFHVGPIHLGLPEPFLPRDNDVHVTRPNIFPVI